MSGFYSNIFIFTELFLGDKAKMSLMTFRFLANSREKSLDASVVQSHSLYIDYLLPSFKVVSSLNLHYTDYLGKLNCL